MESTAFSMAQGNPAIPSVLGAFHGAKSFGLFYGPIALGMGVAEIKLFGLSIVGWRTMGWLGVLALTLLASWLAKRLKGGIAAALTAVLVAFSQGLGRAVSGRLDSLAVALELATLGCAVASLQSADKGIARIYALLTGLSCGLAILSTPRTFPFAAALFFALAVEIVCDRNDRERVKKLLFRTFIVGGVIGILVLTWTAFEKTDPLRWLKFIASASHSDAVNVSPLLGGTWHLLDGPIIERANGFGFVLVLLALLIAALRFGPLTSSAETPNASSGLRFALVTALTNYCLTFALISRPWDYDIFVVPILLPAAVALTCEFFEKRGMRSYRVAALLGAWVLWATICVCIRCGKIAVWAASYKQSDPAPVTRFVSDHVPRGSLVFGPTEFYFYAVQNAGSSYLYARPWIGPGMRRDIAIPRPSWDQLLQTKPVFLIWPSGSQMPDELTPDRLQLVGRFQAEQRRQSWPLSAIPAAGGGYPLTFLYRVVRSPTLQKD